jgi:hypothetical protein
MRDLFLETMEHLNPSLREGDLDSCETRVIAQMHSLPRSPFDIAMDLTISNDPAHAATHFDDFFRAEARRIKIAAAYTEMNGFDINPNRWHCDLFAYTSYGGHDGDYDWLAQWDSEEFKPFVIRGLERLQAVYASDAFHEDAFSGAIYMCDLLVVIKFQLFMKKAAANLKELRFPLLVTAHDFDFIAEFRPHPVS